MENRDKIFDNNFDSPEFEILPQKGNESSVSGERYMGIRYKNYIYDKTTITLPLTNDYLEYSLASIRLHTFL